MLCVKGYNSLVSIHRELLDQYQINLLNGLTENVYHKELECKLTKAQGLLLIHREGYLTVDDLLSWTKQIEELVNHPVYCDELGNDPNGIGDGSDDDGSGEFIWLPTGKVCEEEELIWEGYLAICEDTNNIL